MVLWQQIYRKVWTTVKSYSAQEHQFVISMKIEYWVFNCRNARFQIRYELLRFKRQLNFTFLPQTIYQRMGTAVGNQHVIGDWNLAGNPMQKTSNFEI